MLAKVLTVPVCATKLFNVRSILNVRRILLVLLCSLNLLYASVNLHVTLITKIKLFRLIQVVPVFHTPI